MISPQGHHDYRATAEASNIRSAGFISSAVASSVLAVGVIVAVLHGGRYSESSVVGSPLTTAAQEAHPPPSELPSAQTIPEELPPTRRVPGQGDNQLRWGFQSPSGNIGCLLDGVESPAKATCVIREHTYAVPESLTSGCAPEDPHRFDMTEGQSPSIACAAGLGDFGLPVQQYGKPLSAGSITCVTHIHVGVTCNDSRTGHFFQVARQGYTAG